MLLTRACSINRALDQIGDQWCLLILEQVFRGTDTFSQMTNNIGISKTVLSNRLKWLQSVDCLQKDKGTARAKYHLTEKSADLYHNALMALVWERQFYSTPGLDGADLIHEPCGKTFQPHLVCHDCGEDVHIMDVKYSDGEGHGFDKREVKLRRRSSISVLDSPALQNIYRNHVHILGDRWTSNVINLAFQRITRFDEFHKALPVATNILSNRLKFLVDEGIFDTVKYWQKPPRYEYHLTPKGLALFPYFLLLRQWGDKWCDADNTGHPTILTHTSCNHTLHCDVVCSECSNILKSDEVNFAV